jgi:hypothetical protein
LPRMSISTSRGSHHRFHRRGPRQADQGSRDRPVTRGLVRRFHRRDRAPHCRYRKEKPGAQQGGTPPRPALTLINPPVQGRRYSFQRLVLRNRSEAGRDAMGSPTSGPQSGGKKPFALLRDEMVARNISARSFDRTPTHAIIIARRTFAACLHACQFRRD